MEKIYILTPMWQNKDSVCPECGSREDDAEDLRGDSTEITADSEEQARKTFAASLTQEQLWALSYLECEEKA